MKRFAEVECAPRTKGLSNLSQELVDQRIHDGVLRKTFLPGAAWVGALCLILSFSLAGTIEAQGPATGAINGEVLDSSGALVPDPQVVLVNEETNQSRPATVTTEGFFRANLLAPGHYSLKVEAPGFDKQLVRSIRVTVGETAFVTVNVKVGSTATQIEVTGTSEFVQTEVSALGRPTDEATIVALPLANRNFSQILALSPGVLVEVPNAGALGRNTQNVSANGAKTTSNNFQFNGVDANNISENSFSGFDPEVGIAVPNPDTIAEFKVQTGAYDAGYGRGAGANVDLVSKTGTNNFHGSLWEFFRNDALNANDFFLNRNGEPRPVLKQNQFGGAIGGPIRRSRTFFFASYQGTIQRNGDAPNVSLQSAFLPPLTNDRSAAALGQLFGGQPGAFGGVAVAPDGSNINPVALAILNFKLPNGSYVIPSPQTVLPTGVGQSTFSTPAKYREDQVSANLDYKFSEQNELSGRFFYSRGVTNEPFTPFGANVPGFGTNQTERNDMFVLSDTHVLNPNVVNVARFGFMRFDGYAAVNEPISAAAAGVATPSGLATVPEMTVQGLFTIGSAGDPFYFENVNTFIWQDTVSITRGRHNLRVGGEAKRHQLTVNVPFVSDGFLFFQSFPDFLLGEDGVQNGSGQSNIFQSTGASGVFRKDERYTDLSGFAQDDIKVTPRFSLNLGVRYEYFGPPTEIQGHLSNFDPAIASPQAPPFGTLSGFLLPSNFRGPIASGVTRTASAGFWNADYADITPRVGFALRLRDNPTLVLRGGYGIYYERLSGELAEQNVGQPPFALTQSLQGVQNTAATLQQPFTPPLPPNSAYPIYIPRTPTSAVTVAAIARDLLSANTQQYNLNLQYGFAHDFVWQVGYVGSKTIHLTGCVEFNQALIATPQNPVNGQTTTTVANLSQRVPFTGVAGGSYICNTNFGANYNSLQTSVSKRFSHGLNFEAAYTWSKNLDYTSGTGGLSSLDLDFLSNDQTNPRQAYGLNDFDRTHRFALSFAYEAPKLNKGPSPARYVLSHWQFSGIAVAQSGLPLTATDDTAGSAFGNLPGFVRAECTGANPASTGSVFDRLNGYFNLAAFGPSPVIGDDGQATGFGNCGVGILRGPSQINLDLGIQRNFPVTEGSAFQFRAEFFNFTNTPKFGTPVTDLGAGAAFGVISSTVSNPRIIQLALKYSF